jgi:hypothetical protein
MMILLKDVLGEVRARVPIMGTYGQGQGQRDVGLVGVRVGGEVQRFAMVVSDRFELLWVERAVQ